MTHDPYRGFLAIILFFKALCDFLPFRPVWRSNFPPPLILRLARPYSRSLSTVYNVRMARVKRPEFKNRHHVKPSSVPP